jgi:fucose 4-O-acetylase-like acetyltransferase
MATLRSPVLERVQASTSPARPTRDPWFDNAKMLLIILVVLGHTWSQMPPTTAGSWAYDFVYPWHMPAFVLVTGFLSRSMTWEPRRLLTLLRTVAVPYLIFESALLVFKRMMGDGPVAHPLLVPSSPMWFLLALVVWRLLTPLVLRVPRWLAIGAAVAASLLVGLVPAATLDLARVVGFLPFFVIGAHLRRSDWERLRAPAVWPWAVTVLGALLVVTRHLPAAVPHTWFYYDDSYAELGRGPLAGALTRLAVMAVGLVASAAFFALVPRVRGWFTTLGSATLVVYLFHDFFVVALSRSGYPDLVRGNLALSIFWPSVGAVALALLLASPPVATRLTVLADPFGAWSKRRARVPSSA